MTNERFGTREDITDAQVEAMWDRWWSDENGPARKLTDLEEAAARVGFFGAIYDTAANLMQKAASPAAAGQDVDWPARAWEAFELGAKFQFFIHGGAQCWDGRDLARFFGSADHPAWSEDAGKLYLKRTTGTTPKERGVYIAKQCLHEALVTPPATSEPAEREERPAMLRAKVCEGEDFYWYMRTEAGNWDGPACFRSKDIEFVDRARSDAGALLLYDRERTAASEPREGE